MTDIEQAWGENFGAPKITPQMQQMQHMQHIQQLQQQKTMNNPTPDLHEVHHPPLMRQARLEEPRQPPGPTRAEIYLQDSMASLHRQMESLREEIRRQDKEDKFAKLEKLLKKIALGLLAAIVLGLVLNWFRAEKHMKTLSAYIARLATCRITVNQVLDIVPNLV
jgi:hypothetical protein